MRRLVPIAFTTAVILLPVFLHAQFRGAAGARVGSGPMRAAPAARVGPVAPGGPHLSGPRVGAPIVGHGTGRFVVARPGIMRGGRGFLPRSGRLDSDSFFR